MNVIICGAGEVGTHTAEVLAAEGNSVTVIDIDPLRLRTIKETLDASTLEGNCADAKVLTDAGAEDADLIVTTTNLDEVNLVSASIGHALGALRSIAHVRHSTYFGQHELDYCKHFNIDHLVCPEYSTANAVARSLRNPAALAIEQFAEGRIAVGELRLSAKAAALDEPLSEIDMPPGTRLVAVRRDKSVFLPDAATTLSKGDRVVLVGNSDVYDEARQQFQREKPQLRHVVLMGGTAMAVWLCKALRDRVWSVRLFETDRERAEELARKLPWVTVLNADPTDKSVFAEERIGMTDVFISLLDDDEDNIVGAVAAKAGGVTECVAVVQRPRYLDLLYHIGVDRSYSPGMVAATEIKNLLDDSPLRLLATLATGLDAYELRVRSESPVEGAALREIKLSPDWVIAAIRRAGEVWVPGAEDEIHARDSLLVIGRHGQEAGLTRIFGLK